jgi:alkaline phosphatase
MQSYIGFFVFGMLSLCVSTAWAASAIFFHPDGMGLNTWQAMRYKTVGAGKLLNWDQLTYMGVYTGTMEDSLAATSNGAATTHAYGVKVASSSYGMSYGQPIRAASGFEGSLIHEANAKGLKTALINSGDITEPGTGAFVARVQSRDDKDTIAAQVLESGVDIILSGGEQYLIPEGLRGRHGEGLRKDGRNIIEEALRRGYLVVYTREELSDALKRKPAKLLGVFAAGHTFFDKQKSGPTYLNSAPSIAEMLEATLALLEGHDFLIVAEEEGTDNFANEGRPEAVIEAARRADDALGVMLAEAKQRKGLLLLTASDSDAGGMQLESNKFGEALIRTAGIKDYAGGILARSNYPLPAVVDNTRIYRLIADHLFKPAKKSGQP